ncbi:MAG: hypothetical protein U1D30_06455 [Planctomycetota bacterium]
MPWFSGALDFLLGLIALWIAWKSARLQNDFLFTGFLWVGVAALVGGFNLAGYSQVAPTHEFLSRVGRGPGTFAMGLGVFAAVFGGIPGSRWSAPAVAILGVSLVHLFFDAKSFDVVSLVLGTTLLLSLATMTVEGFRRGRARAAVASLVSLILLLCVAFVLPQLSLPTEGLIRRVDVFHVVLMASYSFLWIGVREMQIENSDDV